MRKKTLKDKQVTPNTDNIELVFKIMESNFKRCDELFKLGITILSELLFFFAFLSVFSLIINPICSIIYLIDSR